MRQPEGFRLGKCLTSNERHETYAAVRAADEREVVLKAVSGASASEARTALSRELDALAAVQGAGIADGLELLPGTRPVLVLAKVSGVGLASWLTHSSPAIPQILDGAIQLADVLDRVHRARLIHCGVAPRTWWSIPPRSRHTCSTSASRIGWAHNATRSMPTGWAIGSPMWHRSRRAG